eukprot:TRINITY_DN1597_c0_g1_i2.p1 TRINITY_DN1597_c0_g1~~TRINITY_DN1597_c0_g1_i2.p1  ORF type:complete len:703 (+),score=144.71 TRINITY_DN1597_c0_g1_i2:59-2167(+)
MSNTPANSSQGKKFSEAKKMFHNELLSSVIERTIIRDDGNATSAATGNSPFATQPPLSPSQAPSQTFAPSTQTMLSKSNRTAPTHEELSIPPPQMSANQHFSPKTQQSQRSLSSNSSTSTSTSNTALAHSTRTPSSSSSAQPFSPFLNRVNEKDLVHTIHPQSSNAASPLLPDAAFTPKPIAPPQPTFREDSIPAATLAFQSFIPPSMSDAAIKKKRQRGTMAVAPSLSSIVKNALRASRLGEPQVEAVMKMFNSLKPQDTALLDREQIRSLLQVLYQAQELLAQQNLNRMLTFIQTTFRMKKEYRNYQLLKKSGEIPRNQAIKNMFLVEENYFHRLRNAFKGPYSDLVVASGNQSLLPINAISAADVKALFGNFDQIFNFHQEVYSSLNTLLATWPYINGSIGKFFLSRLPQLRVYIEYMGNIPLSRETSERLEKNERVKQIIQSTQGEEDGFSVREILDFPISRLGIYETLLTGILGLTSQNHYDYKDLVQAITGIQNMKMLATESLEKAIAKTNAMNIVRRLDKAEGLMESIMAEHAELLYEDDILQVSPRNRTRHLFILTDRILVCNPALRGLQSYRHSLSVGQFTVKDLPESSGFKNAFEITGTDAVVFSAQTPEAKRTWLKHITRIINDAESKQVFGLPIEKIAIREGRSLAPVVVRTCVELLRAKGMTYSGIFRISGDSNTMSDIKSRWNKGTHI